MVGPDGGAADVADEESGEGEGVVADELGIDAPAGLAGEKPVVGVTGDEVARGDGGTAVGLAVHDEPDHVLHVPAGVAELAGKPVKEGGVGRGLALRAEVVEDLGKAGAEELLPEAVHDDAGGEGVFRGEEPVGKVETVELSWGGLVAGGEGDRERGLHHVAGFDHPVAAWEDADGAGLATFGDDATGEGGLVVGDGLPGVVEEGAGAGELGCLLLEGVHETLALGVVALGRCDAEDVGELGGRGQGSWRGDGVGVGGGGDAELAEGVGAVSVALLQFDDEDVAGCELGGPGKAEEELMGLAGVGEHGPAGAGAHGVLVDGRGGRPCAVGVVLGEGGLLVGGAGDGEGKCSRRGSCALDPCDDLGEDKVAVAGAAGALGREGVVGQDLDAEPGELGWCVGEAKGVGVRVRLLAGGEHGPVGLHLEGGVAGRGCGLRGHACPAVVHGDGVGQEPFPAREGIG